MQAKEKAIFIIKELASNGFDAYLVGGCVRDFALGCIPKDYDITTNATPEQVAKIFLKYLIKRKENKFGTVSILIDEEVFEITTFRSESGYIGNRKPSTVKYINSLTEDLSRRDFTMNAIAIDIYGNIIDPFLGMDDINDKLIKCVGNPKERFEEDALRILRALRFSSVLNFDIEEKTSEAIIECHHLLKSISAERIRDEFIKILNGINVLKVLLKYKEVFAYFIPEFKPLFDFNQNSFYHSYDIWEHSARVTSTYITENPMLNVAAIFHDIGKPLTCVKEEKGFTFYKHAEIGAKITETVLNRLKFKKSDIKLVTTLVSNHSISFYNNKKFILKMLNKIGPEPFKLLIKLKFSDILNHSYNEEQTFLLGELIKIEQTLVEIEQEKLCFSLKNLAINGRDLIEAGFKQGKEIGKILQYLFEKVLQQEIDNNKEKLINEALLIKEN